MLIYKAHKIRLRPNNAQANHFTRACGIARFAYNWALSEWVRRHKKGERVTASLLDKRFNAIKDVEFPFVREIAQGAAQKAIQYLGASFGSFFLRTKAGQNPHFPRFRRRGINDSFYVKNNTLAFSGSKVRIPKLGWVRMREALRFDGRILSATVSRTADKWFISVLVEQEGETPKPPGPAVGVDVGIKSLAVVSDGRVFENPKALTKALPRLRLLQKAVSRKRKGSKNRRKAVMRVARQHERIANTRKDAIHKATTAITKGCSLIGIEDLNVRGMLKNRCLSRAVSDASMSEFLRQIEYKAQWRGVAVVKADRFFPSSKMCSECGHVKKDLSLVERTYVCEHCGTKTDRDLNAAVNLRDTAVGSTVAACRLGSSGPPHEGETTDWAGIPHGHVLSKKEGTEVNTGRLNQRSKDRVLRGD